MVSSEGIETNGTVVEILGWWKYKVHLYEYDMMIEGYVSGKMKKNNIRIIPGDYVKVELSQYEPTKWRITYRSTKKFATEEEQQQVKASLNRWKKKDEVVEDDEVVGDEI